MPRVLVVDDDPMIHIFVQRALHKDGHDLVFALNADEAFARLSQGLPDVLLLDLNLPDASGHDILKRLRGNDLYDAIPVVLMSADNNLDAKVKALDMGAVDYLVKPVHHLELAARVRALIRLKKRQDQLIEEYHRLSELSLTDPLTGAYNRRALERLFKIRLAESNRYNIPVSCVLFDLDHFKQVNDTYGHHTGDRVLQEVSALTLALFRQEDALIRYGGEEFLVLLFHTHKEGAQTFAERLRKQVECRVFNTDDRPIRITLSAGISTYPEDSGVKGGETMIALADQRLYTAKRGGRNRVVGEG